AELSVTGPVRGANEDTVVSYLPADPDEKRSRGAFAATADGVSGSGRGGDASRMAVQTALRTFLESKPNVDPRSTLFDVFSAANQAVYDQGMGSPELGRGSTTLTAAIFRCNEVTIGHVGDCRAYAVQTAGIRRLTSDHSYAGLQVRMGLLTDSEAMTSKSRYQLTRSLGHDPFVKVDLASIFVAPGNFIILCSDGLHSSVREVEILNAVLRLSPGEACQHLVKLAERRGSQDNISIQIARVDRVERVAYSRGIPYYPSPSKGESPQTRESVGTVLDNRFELQSLINEGGMAAVYRALDRSTGQTVAVKIPFMRYESDPGSYSRFEREEEIGTLLKHPSILRVIPVEGKSRPYIVMEYLEGQTLAQLLSQVSPLPVDDAVRIASRLADALEYVHEAGIVHRDLKPQNIMICDDGSLRVMDFGIAKAPGGRAIDVRGLSPMMGTPDYMAPEQVQGHPGDERTDIYSLGVILYEMVTDALPFTGDNASIIMNSRLSGDPRAPRKIRPEISPVLEEIILHALARNPDERFRSMTAFKSDLDHQDLVTVTGRVDRLQPPKPWETRWRRLRTVVISMLLILGLFGLLYVISHGEKGQPRPKEWKGR
ncbi:MAG TPA: protein kinase, partial [Planctomycetota bacterium]|nr:protein kinase [Planctomycetota bacterium]